MKKLMLFLFIVPLITSSCKKEDPELFEMLYAENFTIPAGLNPFDTHYFLLKDIPVGTYLSARNLTPDMLKAINPKAASFINTFAGSANYDFLRDVSVRIYTDDINNSKELFYYDLVPENTGDNLGLIPSLADARAYLNGSVFNIEIRLNFKRAPLQNIETQFRFSLSAK